MCGRFVHKGDPEKVAQDLGVVFRKENWTTSYKVAPVSMIQEVLTRSTSSTSLVLRVST